MVKYTNGIEINGNGRKHKGGDSSAVSRYGLVL